MNHLGRRILRLDVALQIVDQHRIADVGVGHQATRAGQRRLPQQQIDAGAVGVPQGDVCGAKVASWIY